MRVFRLAYGELTLHKNGRQNKGKETEREGFWYLYISENGSYLQGQNVIMAGPHKTLIPRIGVWITHLDEEATIGLCFNTRVTDFEVAR